MWTEVRNNMVRKKCQPSSNYGIVHEDGIAQCFSLRFVELYNNTSSDISEMIVSLAFS